MVWTLQTAQQSTGITIKPSAKAATPSGSVWDLQTAQQAVAQPIKIKTTPQPIVAPKKVTATEKLIVSAKEATRKISDKINFTFTTPKFISPILQTATKKAEDINIKLGPILSKIYVPRQYQIEEIQTGKKFKPTAGKIVGGAIEDAISALLPVSGIKLEPLKEGVKLTQRLVGGIKTGTTFAGVHALIKGLKQEKIELPELLTSGGIGFWIGLSRPFIMKDITRDAEIGAKETLKKYGFKAIDFKSPQVLKSKFYKVVMRLHPDKGGNTQDFKEFVDAYNKTTSAGIEPTWKLPDIKAWIRNLWKYADKSEKEKAIIKSKADADFVKTVNKVVEKKPGVETGLINVIKQGENTPQDIINTVIKSKAENTPEGKNAIKSALEAEKQGKNILVEKPPKEEIQKPIPQIPKALEPLTQEARKYKSAEEFVRAQIEPTYPKDFRTYIIETPEGLKEGKLTGKPSDVSGKPGQKYRKYTFNIDGKTIKIENPKVFNTKTEYVNGQPISQTKSQLTDIWNKANTGSKIDPLVAEARKYKSAEEFVNSFERQFHGSPRADLQEIGFGTGVRSNPFLGTSKEVKSSAIFFTKDKNVADTFAKNRVEYLATKNEKGVPTVYERFINKKGILDLTKPKNIDDVFEKLEISAEEEILGTIPDYGTGEAFSDLLEAGHLEMGSLFEIFDKPNLVKKFKDAGYSGVRLIEKGGLGKSTAIFDPKKAFSKSQLTDFYNQAVKGIEKPVEKLTKEAYTPQQLNTEVRLPGRIPPTTIADLFDLYSSITKENVDALLSGKNTDIVWISRKTGEEMKVTVESMGKPTIKVPEVKPEVKTVEKKEQKPKRGEITKLENRLNELVGFTSAGEHWKMQYHIRNAYIDEALVNAPPNIQREVEEIVSRLNEIRWQKEVGGFATKGEFANLEVLTKTTSDIPIIEFPEMVKIAKEISEKIPLIKRNLRGAYGKAYPKKLEIMLQADIFKNPTMAAKVFSHEIGHIIDFLPQGFRSRSLLVGRMLSLNNFMKQIFGDLKDKIFRMELKKLSYEWRPLVGGIETPYRRESSELYADAISVLFNDPVRLQKTAPTFWKAFFENLDKKPSVKKVLLETWDLLHQGEEAVFKKRDEEITGSFRKGEEIFAAKFLENQKRQSSLWYQVKLLFDDKNTPIKEKINQLRKQGKDVPADLNPDYALKGLLYSDAELKNYVEDNLQPIFAEAQAMPNGWEEFGKILFYDRVINERGEFANPQGYNPKTAQFQLEQMEKADPETFKKLQAVKVKFREVIQESITYAEENGYYTSEMIATMKANPAYATFQVLDYLDTYITARAYHQVGTLKDIANPATSSVMKLISLRKAIKRNNAKKMNVNFLKKNHPQDIEPAQTRWNGRSLDIKAPRERGKDLVITIEAGRPKGYYVDKDVADMLNYGSDTSLEAIGRFSRIVSQSGFYRPLFTVYNLGFQTFNFVRDLRRVWKNYPHQSMNEVWLAPLFDAYKLGTGYAKAVKPSLQRALKRPNELIKEMENANMLGLTYNDIYSGAIDPEVTQMERILERYGLLPKKHQYRLLKPFIWALDGLGAFGDFIETMPKVAGYIRLKGTMMEAELAEFIRTSIGSPAFRVGGKATPITNSIFLFSNAIKEGLKTDLKFATGKQGKASAASFWYKTLLADLLPKMIMYGIALGYAGKKLKDIMDSASEYDKSNYTIIPVGEDENGKAVYLRIPHDETGRFMGGIFWKILNINKLKDDAESIFDIFAFGAGQFPNITPAFSGISAIFQYMSGQNPYDSYRGRNIIPDYEFKAGPKYSLPIFLEWLAKNQGLGIFFPTYKPKKDQELTDLEKVIYSPVLSNIIGRWIKVSDYGQREKLQDVSRTVEKEQAQRFLKERETIENAVLEYKKNPQLKQHIENRIVKEIATQIKDPGQRKAKITNVRKKFRIAILRGESDQQLNSLIDASTNAEKAELLKVIKQQTTNEEFKSIIRTARKYKIISDNVIRLYRK